jgi:hypothetical protein
MVEVEVIGWEEAEETVEIEEIAMIEAGIEDLRAEEVVVMTTGQNRGVRHSVKKEEAAATVLEEEEVEEEVKRLNQTGAESHLLAALEAFLEVVAVVSQAMVAGVSRAVAAEVFLGLAHDEKYPSQLKDPN